MFEFDDLTVGSYTIFGTTIVVCITGVGCKGDGGVMWSGSCASKILENKSPV